MKVVRVNDDVVVLDARGTAVTDNAVAERINEALGFETVGTQLANRKPGEGLYIGPAPQTHVYRMASIDPRIFLGSRKEMRPNQTRSAVRKALGLK